MKSEELTAKAQEEANRIIFAKNMKAALLRRLGMTEEEYDAQHAKFEAKRAEEEAKRAEAETKAQEMIAAAKLAYLERMDNKEANTAIQGMSNKPTTPTVIFGA